MKTFFLNAETATTEPLDELTPGNVLLDESGQLLPPSEAIDNITTWWETFDIATKINEKIPAVIVALILTFIGIILSRLLSKFVTKTLKARNVDPSVYNFIGRSVSVVIKAAFITLALSLFFNINSIVTAIGAAGVAAGLGLQDSVAQFASGIQILLNHPFKDGDYVEVNGVQGHVTDIRFMNTVITTADNKRIIIPNSHITTSHIINYSAEDIRRLDLVYSISYTANIAEAKNVILNVAELNELVLSEPAPGVFVNSHESSSINLVAKIWCKSPDYWSVYHSMQEAVKLAFDENNISIPFNQLDVHLKKDD